jgi:two-component system phosphate regulon response regulator OmpR
MSDSQEIRRARVLVIDDEADLRLLLERYLGDQGFSVTTRADGREVSELLKREAFDILVLDLMMPHESGLSICQRLRSAGEVIPILMLTAKGDPVDRIIGLESGADDYLAKPFTPRELVARIQAQLRRRSMDAKSASSALEQIAFGPFVLDLKTRRLLREGVPVELSSVEFVVLRALAQHANVELTRDRLLDLSKGSDSSATDRSIDVQVMRLRRSIEDDPSNPRWIRTVRGVGYVFVPDAI